MWEECDLNFKRFQNKDQFNWSTNIHLLEAYCLSIYMMFQETIFFLGFHHIFCLLSFLLSLAFYLFYYSPLSFIRETQSSSIIF